MPLFALSYLFGKITTSVPSNLRLFWLCTCAQPNMNREKHSTTVSVLSLIALLWTSSDHWVLPSHHNAFLYSLRFCTLLESYFILSSVSKHPSLSPLLYSQETTLFPITPRINRRFQEMPTIIYTHHITSSVLTPLKLFISYSCTSNFIANPCLQLIGPKTLNSWQSFFSYTLHCICLDILLALPSKHKNLTHNYHPHF